jgi:hypothetical protein
MGWVETGHKLLCNPKNTPTTTGRALPLWTQRPVKPSARPSDCPPLKDLTCGRFLTAFTVHFRDKCPRHSSISGTVSKPPRREISHFPQQFDKRGTWHQISTSQVSRERSKFADRGTGEGKRQNRLPAETRQAPHNLPHFPPRKIKRLWSLPPQSVPRIGKNKSDLTT